jgi:murein DD-endopeptidase MepM/ murein hydrolase activator NlpD
MPEHHTIIFVPHAQARLRKWRVSNRQIKLALSALLTLTLAATYVTWSFFSHHVDQVALDRLATENRTLREVNVTFEENLESLQDQLVAYEERTRQLAIVAGLEPLDGLEAGIGGDSVELGDDYAGYRPVVDDLSLRVGDLSGQLDRVEKRLQSRNQLISSTPAITPVKGIFTSGYGLRRDPISGSRAFHQGLDIAAGPGQPVKASADGIVTRAGNAGGLGNAVFLAHGYGLVSRYGHLSKVAVEPGTKIRRGEIIGYVGNSGRSTGYHLHYEVHRDGEPVDPLAYIHDRH